MGIAKNQNNVCAAEGWNVGGSSGSGIYAPDGTSAGYIVSVFRSAKHWMNQAAARSRSGKYGAFRYGEMNGLTLTLEEARRNGTTLNNLDRELLLRGYVTLFRPKSFWDRAKFEERARKQGRLV